MVFKKFKKASKDLAGLGVVTAVGAGIASRGSPAIQSGIGAGFNTLAGFAPIGVTAVAGGSVLKKVKKLYKVKK